MKRAVLFLAAGLAACHGGGSSARMIQVSEVQGAESDVVARVDGGAGSSTHRVVTDSRGKILFEYKLQVAGVDPDGTYRIALKPSGKGATFAASREIAMQEHDKVRVELLEEPGTGRKIVDVLTLAEPETFGHHLLQLHNRFYHWVHGE